MKKYKILKRICIIILILIIVCIISGSIIEVATKGGKYQLLDFLPEYGFKAYLQAICTNFMFANFVVWPIYLLLILLIIISTIKIKKENRK